MLIDDAKAEISTIRAALQAVENAAAQLEADISPGAQAAWIVLKAAIVQLHADLAHAADTLGSHLGETGKSLGAQPLPHPLDGGTGKP
jgi:hypothetical protein